jgi:hypothetical protein
VLLEARTTLSITAAEPDGEASTRASTRGYACQSHAAIAQTGRAESKLTCVSFLLRRLARVSQSMHRQVRRMICCTISSASTTTTNPMPIAKAASSYGARLSRRRPRSNHRPHTPRRQIQPHLQLPLRPPPLRLRPLTIQELVRPLARPHPRHRHPHCLHSQVHRVQSGECVRAAMVCRCRCRAMARVWMTLLTVPSRSLLFPSPSQVDRSAALRSDSGGILQCRLSNTMPHVCKLSCSMTSVTRKNLVESVAHGERQRSRVRTMRPALDQHEPHTRCHLVM